MGVKTRATACGLWLAGGWREKGDLDKREGGVRAAGFVSAKYIQLFVSMWNPCQPKQSRLKLGRIFLSLEKASKRPKVKNLCTPASMMCRPATKESTYRFDQETQHNFSQKENRSEDVGDLDVRAYGSRHVDGRRPPRRQHQYITSELG